ncbi:MAG: TetR/AcrR family transcriptional regulator [Pseudomonadales bacterium]|nr:TetR/AcrR family transcriptional regulator [Halioglobus sp.]MCP5127985.1 TetR/AcrR family transcriptional regulator [Pseudomonadales bacterium]
MPQVRKPSQRRSQQRVSLILEATAEVLRTRGIAEVTTNSIAEQASIPVSSIYQYFPNKEAILVALYSDYLQSIEEVMDEFETRARLEQPWDAFFTESLKAIYRQETRDQIDRELQNGLNLFPELMEIENAHRQKFAERLAGMLRKLGSKWSTPRLKRLSLFVYEINTAAWRHRIENKVISNELLEWETAAILAVVGRCM